MSAVVKNVALIQAKNGILDTSCTQHSQLYLSKGLPGADTGWKKMFQDSQQHSGGWEVLEMSFRLAHIVWL